MSRNRLFGRLAGICLTALATGPLFAAVNGTWNWFTEGYTNGLSIEAAADWNDTANWVDGVVPRDRADNEVGAAGADEFLHEG